MESQEVVHGCILCRKECGHLFCNLPSDLAQRIVAVSSTTISRRKTRLFVEGEEPRGVFVLCTGKAKLSTCSSMGKNIITRINQRSPAGVQTDLTILGSTFAENLVLVNGMRVNDSQTAHHDMDIPIPTEAITRMEVLHGAGSAFYGADAMGGAVNIITAPALSSEV